jgi:hypothetical protein
MSSKDQQGSKGHKDSKSNKKPEASQISYNSPKPSTKKGSLTIDIDEELARLELESLDDFVNNLEKSGTTTQEKRVEPGIKGNKNKVGNNSTSKLSQKGTAVVQNQKKDDNVQDVHQDQIGIYSSQTNLILACSLV